MTHLRRRFRIIKASEKRPSGMAALIFDAEKKAVVYDLRKFEKRSIQEPTEETYEGFQGILYRGS